MDGSWDVRIGSAHFRASAYDVIHGRVAGGPAAPFDASHQDSTDACTDDSIDGSTASITTYACDHVGINDSVAVSGHRLAVA